MSNARENTEHCLEMVRQNDPDRYYSVLFAPVVCQPALLALLAFNQEVAKTRESVSEPMLGEIRLQWWRETVESLMAGATRAHPVAEALAAHDVAAQVGAQMLAIIEARGQDMYDDGPADFDALVAYAGGVGGTLNEAILLLCDAGAGAEAKAAAHAAGRAWAMLGLVRALPFHWQAGRSFVPQDAADNIGGFEDAGKLSEALRPIIGKMLEYVMAEADAVAGAAKSLPKVARPAVLITVLTRLYLKALARVGNDPFAHQVAEPGSLRRLSALAWANFRGKF